MLIRPGRPQTADRCNDVHEVEIGGEIRRLLCQRRRDHIGDHSTGSVNWARRRRQSPARTGTPPRPSLPPR
jgi:hypothetical protein